MVSLKDGTFINGLLKEVDFWMNLTLVDVIETSKVSSGYFSITEWVKEGDKCVLTINTKGRREVFEIVRDIYKGERHSRHSTQ